ncbi:hypothetical protein HO133_009566 [Letharia lupina]|uniref:Uncharacterized protein n=1 Tax=Letharia lupina TaxID=560253 RepID=A0A8H6CLT2_9LECA|nr:uncharacterized protein HO133_009566 [Letharia lupina]KAF6225566.1 hypothetical protein HO133_009566 [Letharia lupina]
MFFAQGSFFNIGGFLHAVAGGKSHQIDLKEILLARGTPTSHGTRPLLAIRDNMMVKQTTSDPSQNRDLAVAKRDLDTAVGKVSSVSKGFLDPGGSMAKESYAEPVDELGKVSEDQIEDAAKSDTFTKLIACGQTLWFATNVISPFSECEAVTLLEVSTPALCRLVEEAPKLYSSDIRQLHRGRNSNRAP